MLAAGGDGVVARLESLQKEIISFTIRASNGRWAHWTVQAKSTKTILAMPEETRRSPRVPLESLFTEIEVGGVHYPVQVRDISQHGLRIVLNSGVEIKPETEVKIAIGKISTNMRGRVRWAGPQGDAAGQQLGVEFESFVIEEPGQDEVAHLMDAWREISHTYSVFESFLHILQQLDAEIVEGTVDDLSEVIYSVATWLDERVGPLNLWGTLQEPSGQLNVQPLVARHPRPQHEWETRVQNVRTVAQEGLTGWFDGRPYLFGSGLVIEYLGQNEGQVDVLQRLTVLLAKRIQFWSRLLMKNIALRLFGEELERLQVERANNAPD